MNPEILWVIIKAIFIAYASRLSLAVLAEIIDEVRHEVRRAKRKHAKRV